MPSINLNEHDKRFFSVKRIIREFVLIFWYFSSDLYFEDFLKKIFILGVEVKFKNFVYPIQIHPILVEELTEVVYEKEGIRFGAAVTLNEINDVLRTEIATKPGMPITIFWLNVAQ